MTEAMEGIPAEEAPSASEPPKEREIALEMHGVSKMFGKTLALSGATMRVPKGAVYALLGRNGTGKSTLLQVAMGLLEPTTGQVRVMGMDPSTQGRQMRERVGYIPERLQLYDWMTVSELLNFTGSQYERWSRDEEERLVAKFRLDRKKRVRDLSRGNSALLLLVMAMAHNPELVLLDECTSGMDAIYRTEFDRSVIETLHDTQRTVVFASHQIRELEFLCDWVGILHDGQIMMQMSIEDLKSSVKTLRVQTEDGIAPPPLPKELSRQGLGREWLITVSDVHWVTPQAVPGVRIQETVDLTLEQIFIALLSGEGVRS